MMKKKKRSQDQINKIRDHLKRMISFPLQTNESDTLSPLPSDNLNVIPTQPQRASVTLPVMEQTFHVAMITSTPSRVNRPVSTEPMVDNPEMFNTLQLKTTSKKVVSSNGRLCKVRKYTQTTLVQYLLQREEKQLHLVKPDLSYGQLICLAILQSPDEKLILSQICEWISTSFPFFKLKDMNWQNCIRHTLSINPSFVKLESIKIAKAIEKTTFVFIGKDKSAPNRQTKNFRKSSRWGVTEDGVTPFFDYEYEGLNSFKIFTKQINQYLPRSSNVVTPMFTLPQKPTQLQTFPLPSQKNQQQYYQFQPQLPQRSPLDGKDGSNSSSPLSVMSHNSTSTSTMSSTTDLATMTNEKSVTLMAPTIIISNSPPIDDPKVKEDDEIIYDIDAKLDLLKTPKFDTSPIRKYFLNNIDAKLEGNINDSLEMNKYNHNILSQNHLKIGSPSQLAINSILNSYDDQNFVFHL